MVSQKVHIPERFKNRLYTYFVLFFAGVAFQGERRSPL